jgi:RHS repeat-associated protein
MAQHRHRPRSQARHVAPRRRWSLFRARGWSSPPLVIATILALLTSMAVAVTTLAIPARQALASSDVTSRGDLVSAAITAALEGHRVEVGDLETPTSTTYANPDGTATTDIADGVVRVKQADGSWAAPDLTLQYAGGAYRPTVAPENVSFTGGGDKLAATWQDAAGELVGLNWANNLPAPTISGGIATYKISSTLNLIVASTAEGFSVHLQLLAPPPVGTTSDSFTLPLREQNVTPSPNQDGSIDFVNGAGTHVARLRHMMMWDAQTDAAGDPTNMTDANASLVHDGSGNPVLDLNPSLAFLQSPLTKYPVTIDPDLVSLSNFYDTDFYRWSGSASNGQWVSNSSGNSGAYNLVVGTYVSNGVTYDVRSYIHPALGQILGKHVTSATLSLFEYDAATCTAKQTDFLPTTAAATTSTVWSNQPGTTATGKVSASFNTGASACNTNAYQNIDLTSMMQKVATQALTWNGLDIDAPSANELDTSYEKRFCSANYASGTACATANNIPKLSITYNSYPATASSMSISPSVMGTTGYRYITNLTPTLHAAVADADPNTSMRVDFELDHDTSWTSESDPAVVWTGSATAGPAGQIAAATIPSGKLVDEHHYLWKARGFDGIDYGAWSPLMKFKPNVTHPPTPTVACSTFPSGTWTHNQPTSSDTCSLSTTGTDIAGFLYSFDNPDPQTQAPTRTSPVTIHVPTTLSSGWHTLYAALYDPAYNRSNTVAAYSFGVGLGGLSSPTDGDRTQQNVTLASKADTTEDGVTYNYRLGTAGTWTTVPTTDVTIPGTQNHPTWPQAVSGGSFPALIWNVASTVTAAGGDDGPVQLEACFSHTGIADTCSTATTLTLARRAFDDSNAMTTFGPGTLALLTGDLQVGGNDAVAPTSTGTLSFGRTFTSLAPSTATSGAQGIFGPAWVAGLPSPGTGAAAKNLKDFTAQRYATLTDTAGTVSTYLTSDSGYPYTFIGTGDADDGSILTKTNSTTFQLSEADGTVTNWTYNGTTQAWQVSSVVEPGSHDTTSYTFDSSGRVSEVLAPVPAGVTCTSPKTTRGCAVLDLNYAATTTASSDIEAGWGDYVGRLATVTFTAYDPATSSMAAKTVAQYAYDTQGMLRAVWDPRISPALKTKYAYDANKRLTTLTPPGLNSWTINYDSSGRVASVQRTDPVNGTATQAVAYGVPTTGSGAPVNLASSQTSTWGQTVDLPVTGTAVFPADHVPAAGAGGAYAPTSTDWPYGSISYLDVNGREVNSASYGAGAWQVDATRYDSNGNVVWQLTGSNRAQAVTPTSDTDPDVAGLASSQLRADALATTSGYSGDGVDLVDTYGPTHVVTLDDGTVVSARAHTHHVYNENTPDSSTNFHLETTSTTAAFFDDGSGSPSDHDTRTTHTGYDPINTGDTSGWTLRALTTQTTVLPGGNDILSKTRYDADGRVIESRMPGGPNGGDAHATLTTYYTAAANGTYPECGGHAEWAGQVCRAAPAAQPSGTPVPVTETTYNAYAQPATVTETSGSVTRTTTRTYDAAGRALTVHVNDASSGVTQIPDVTTGYDPTTGLPTTASTATQTLTTGFDALGRATSYTAPTASGTNTATTSYDIDGRPLTVNDGKGTTTYSYDGTDQLGRVEHRGLLTGENAGMGSLPSAFAGAYDADGNLVSESYPNGLVATSRYDNAGQQTDLNYAKSGTTWAEFTQSESVFGQIRTQSSPESSQTYAYDTDSRLATVQDNGDGVCFTRTYGFDADSNRTTQNSYPADSTGACSMTTTPNSATHVYDAADRLVDSGYSYDNLGRVVTTPGSDTVNPSAGALTVTYFANNMVHSQTQGGRTKTWTLDPAARLLSVADTGAGSTGLTATNVYTDRSDSPAWIGDSNGGWTRNVQDLTGQLASVQSSAGTAAVQLVNLHGDVVATVDDSSSATAPGPSSYFEDTEFGGARASNTVTPQRYAWLGNLRRSSDAMSGLILMGKRQYNVSTGRFITPDPIPGGSANNYDYSNQDPVNKADPSGCSWCLMRWSITHPATGWWRFTALIYSHGFSIIGYFGTVTAISAHGGHWSDFMAGGARMRDIIRVSTLVHASRPEFFHVWFVAWGWWDDCEWWFNIWGFYGPYAT